MVSGILRFLDTFSYFRAETFHVRIEIYHDMGYKVVREDMT